MKVGIVGGGIGGLAAAIGLQRCGADVRVLERRDVLEQPGTGLSIFGNGWTALDAIGVGDAVRAVAAEAPMTLQTGQRRSDGRWLSRISAGAIRDLRIVHRAELHQALVAQLAPGTVLTGRAVDSVTPEGRVAVVADGIGRSEHFDVVVAADGLRSSVRASWPGDPGLRYSGYSAWRGVTGTPVDLSGAAGETWGAGLRFGLVPLRDARVYWFGVANLPPDIEYDDDFAVVAALFSRWHAPIGQVIAATRPADVHRLPIEDLARPLATFRRGRCVLLGDAAHAMTPDLGQGANQAMEDAACLTGLLAPIAQADAPAEDSVARALATYDSERRRRTQRIARLAHAVGRIGQARGGVRVRLRDTAMQIVPARLLDRQLRSLQQWTPPAPEVSASG